MCEASFSAEQGVSERRFPNRPELNSEARKIALVAASSEWTAFTYPQFPLAGARSHQIIPLLVSWLLSSKPIFLLVPSFPVHPKPLTTAQNSIWCVLT